MLFYYALVIPPEQSGYVSKHLHLCMWECVCSEYNCFSNSRVLSLFILSTENSGGNCLTNWRRNLFLLKKKITIFIHRVYKLGFQKQIIHNFLCLSYQDIVTGEKIKLDLTAVY